MLAKLETPDPTTTILLLSSLYPSDQRMGEREIFGSGKVYNLYKRY